LGSGALLGSKYRGFYKGNEVLILAIRENKSDEELEEIKKELLLRSSIQSPYLVSFLGAAIEPKIFLVEEFCSRGHLLQVMSDVTEHITWDKVFRFAKDIAKGLDALHSFTPPIFHGDLNSSSILITEDYHAKVTGFGLTKLNSDSNGHTLKK